MKAVSFTLLIGLCSSAFSQDTFSDQLKKILADTSNDFSSIKGEFKKAYDRFDEKDSVFYSKIKLIDLRETEYLKVVGFYIIQGKITDSVSEKNGKRILKEWKKKVRTVVGKSFTVKKDDRMKPAEYTWVFKKDDVEITISLDRMLGEPNYPYYDLYFSIQVWDQEDFLKTIKEDTKE